MASSIRMVPGLGISQNELSRTVFESNAIQVPICHRQLCSKCYHSDWSLQTTQLAIHTVFHVSRPKVLISWSDWFAGERLNPNAMIDRWPGKGWALHRSWCRARLQRLATYVVSQNFLNLLGVFLPRLLEIWLNWGTGRRKSPLLCTVTTSNKLFVLEVGNPQGSWAPAASAIGLKHKSETSRFDNLTTSSAFFSKSAQHCPKSIDTCLEQGRMLEVWPLQ